MTITYDDDIWRAILNYRGDYLAQTYKDKNNTEAINELLREVLTQKGYIQPSEVSGT